MNNHSQSSRDQQELSGAEPLPNISNCPDECRCAASDALLVRDGIEAGRARAAADEAELWERTFATSSPADYKSNRRDRTRLETTCAYGAIKVSRQNGRP